MEKKILAVENKNSKAQSTEVERMMKKMKTDCEDDCVKRNGNWNQEKHYDEFFGEQIFRTSSYVDRESVNVEAPNRNREVIKEKVLRFRGCERCV